MFDDLNDDDLLVSPRVLEMRRTSVIKPLGVGGLTSIAIEIPMELASLHVEITPQVIAQKVRARMESDIARKAYTWPTEADYQAVMSEDRLEELCLLFERNYGNGFEFRDGLLCETEKAALLRSCHDLLFEPYARLADTGAFRVDPSVIR
jgi:hypothetical protein